MVRVERAAAEAGKVLPATERARLAEAGEEGFSVGDDTLWIVRDDASAHHFGRGWSAQVEHWREGDVESEQAKL